MRLASACDPGLIEMKKKFFYGWVIVFACMLLAAASTGLLSYLNPLFVTPVTEELGISRATFMVYQTFSTVATIICMPLASSIYKKVPMKRMLLIGTACGVATHLCYSIATNVAFFYLGGVLSGIATCLYGSIPIAILTTNWFWEKKGIATGIAFAGTGVASSLLSPVISNVIANYGWRTGYRLISLLILLIMIPAIFVLIRETPAQMGLLPLGKKETQVGPVEKLGFSQKQIFKTKSFWLMALGIFLLGSVTGPAQQQLVAYWIGEGNTPAFAASMYSVVMFVAIFTKILLGGVYDHMSITRGTVAVGAVSVASYVALLFFKEGYGILIPAALFGVTVSVQVLVSTYVINRLFGDKEYAFIYSIMTPVLYGGVAVGSPLSAAIFDHFGNYYVLWIICAVVFAGAIAIAVAADKYSQKEYQKILGYVRE